MGLNKLYPARCVQTAAVARQDMHSVLPCPFLAAQFTSSAILPTVRMAFLASFSSMSFTYSVSSVAMS